MDKDSLTCPITHQIYLNPVCASDGHIYERAALTRWLSQHNFSPLTREPLKHKFYEVYLIKKLVDELLQKYPELKNEQFCESDDYTDFCKTFWLLIEKGDIEAMKVHLSQHDEIVIDVEGDTVLNKILENKEMLIFLSSKNVIIREGTTALKIKSLKIFYYISLSLKPHTPKIKTFSYIINEIRNTVVCGSSILYKIREALNETV